MGASGQGKRRTKMQSSSAEGVPHGQLDWQVAAAASQLVPVNSQTSQAATGGPHVTKPGTLLSRGPQLAERELTTEGGKIQSASPSRGIM